MKNLLWKCPDTDLKKSNLFKFEDFLKKKYGFNCRNNFDQLCNWSIKNPGNFWKSIWEFCNLKGRMGKKIIKNSKVFYKNKFFPDSKLNFSKNLLAKKDESIAVTFISENGYKEKRTWKDLNNNVNKISKWLKEIGLSKNDRVAAYLPNYIETVEAFLATSSIGAIWSSCSPDFGTKGVIERFSQINPKILFIADMYYYNGKKLML